VPHTFDNIRKDNIGKDQPPVKVINLMTPAGYEGVFAANEDPDAAADPAVRDQINADHNVAYVRPPLRVKARTRMTLDTPALLSDLLVLDVSRARGSACGHDAC
jgi:hypothetical protein